MNQETALRREAAVFAEHLEEWRSSHLGEVVLIKGNDVIGFYPSLDKAFKAGTDRFGLDPFFLKQIVPGDAVNVSFYGRPRRVAAG